MILFVYKFSGQDTPKLFKMSSICLKYFPAAK